MPDPEDYITKSYTALKDNLRGFNKTPEQFRELITKDTTYRNKVYSALKDNIQGFDKTPETFNSLVGTQKKNGLSVGTDGSLRSTSQFGLLADRIKNPFGFSDQIKPTLSEDYTEDKKGSSLVGGTALLKGFASVASSTLKSIGIAAKRIDLFNEYGEKKAEDLATYKAGQWIDDKVKDLAGELSPEEQDKFSVKLAHGVGQMGGFVLGGWGGRVLKVSPLLTTAGLGAAVGGASEYEAAIQSGATEDQAAKAFWLNAGIYTTEVLPIMGAFRKLDKYTGGLATGALAKRLSSTVGGRITNDVAQGFITEASQEAVSQLMTNVVASKTYDAARNIYDGLLESAAIGGIIGGSMNGIASSIRERRNAVGLTKEEDNQLAITQKFAEEKANEALNPDKNEVTTNTPNNKKVKAITKAKTDLEADLSSSNLPEETKVVMQSEVAALDQQLDEAKTEAYQQELESKTADILQGEINKNEALLADNTLTEGTKAVIQKSIDADKEKLAQIDESGVEVQEPTIEEKIKDFNEGNSVTFTYKSEEEIPEVLKDKVTSFGETNGEKIFRVTLSKVEADYLLKSKENATPVASKEQPTLRTEEDIFNIIKAPVPTGKLKRMEVQVKSIDPETNEVTLEKMTAKKAIVDMKKQIGIIDLIKKCL